MPRQGLAIDISTLAGSEGVVTTIDDFFFESFSAGEMHPILTTSRTNLITYSEDISNADWSKSLVTAASSIASPVSSNSFLIEETSYSSAVPGLQLAAGISVSAGTYTGSFYVKKNNLRYLGIVLGTSAQRIRTNFDFNTETFKTPLLTGQTTGAVSFEKDGDFYRISVKATFPSTVAAVFSLHPLATDTYPFFAFQDSDNRSFHVSGFQLEQDSFASAYIPTSGSAVTVSTTLNDTSEVWDFDGTDITLQADPEDEGFWEEGSNLVLNHDYEDLGSELVTNGTFDLGSELVTNGDFASNITGWSAKDCTIVWDNGKLKADNSSGNANGGAFQNIGLVTGKQYKVTATMQLLTGSSNGTFNLFTSSSTGTGQSSVYTGSTLVVGGAAVTETFYFTPGSGDVSIQFTCDEANATYTIDNISVKEVVGWTLVGDFEIDGTKAFITSASQYSQCTQQLGSTFLTSGKSYKLEADITTSITNALAYRVTGGSVVPIATSDIVDGKYTAYFTMSSNGYFWFQTTGSYTGLNATIDNVSVKEVDPNDRWTLGTGWTISDGKAHADTSSTAALSQTISTGAGNTYEVTFTISNFTTGVLQPQFDGILATPTQINSNGTHTVKITALGSSHGLLLYAIGTSEFSIDNVTIKEYAIKPKDI